MATGEEETDAISKANNFTLRWSSYFTIIGAVLNVIFVIGLLTLMTRKTETLIQLSPQYGFLYSNLKIDKVGGRLYPVIFIAKRVTFINMMLYSENSEINVNTMTFIILFSTVFLLQFKPFILPYDLRLEFFNNFMAYCFIASLRVFN